MCGRFTLRASPRLIAEQFDLFNMPELKPRYNVAPSQSVAVVRQQPDAEGRELALLKWGLIPAWAADAKIGNRMANAHSETAASKPSFRSAFKRRRCLVVADGFYEWQKVGSKKQPHFIRLRDDRPFGIAGLWERWDKQGEPIESCTLLTTEPNELMKPIHDRMPVIIPAEKVQRLARSEVRRPGTAV
jgi:putative SOS response-associated peptidase YedK